MRARVWPVLAAVLLAASAAAAADPPITRMPGGHGGGGGPSRGSPPVVIKMRSVPMPRAQSVQTPGAVVRDQRHMEAPRADDRGARVTMPRASSPPRSHTTIVRNPALLDRIRVERGGERVQGRYYWHRWGGVRYCHFIDPEGIQWYGFYHGPRFYWTRWYSGFWWWYDPVFSRWVYWNSGYWWWPNPAGGLYVFVDNTYYPYDGTNGEVVVKQPQVEQPPPAPPAVSQGGSYDSPDGRRLVQVAGENSEAFLYDRTGREPVFLKYLARDVQKVRFTGGADGKPLRILLDFNDGAFALFDANGQPLDSR